MADYDLQYQDTHIDALLATANELKTAGYIYKGVATPSTNPGTPTERVAYLASEPGTYTNFGGIVIASGLYSLTYAGGTWTGTQMSAGSDIEVVQTTGQSASDVMSQKAVTDSLPLTNVGFFIPTGSNVNGWATAGGWLTTSTRNSYVIPRESTWIKMKVTANDDYGSIISFLDNTYTQPINGHSSEFISTENVTKNTSKILDIPSNCAYIVINASPTNNNTTEYAPTGIEMYGLFSQEEGVVNILDTTYTYTSTGWKAFLNSPIGECKKVRVRVIITNAQNRTGRFTLLEVNAISNGVTTNIYGNYGGYVHDADITIERGNYDSIFAGGNMPSGSNVRVIIDGICPQVSEVDKMAIEGVINIPNSPSAFVAANGKWVVGNANYQGVFVPVLPNTAYRIVGNANVGTQYALLTSNSYVGGEYISTFASGEYIRVVPTGQEQVFVTPNDANYINVGYIINGVVNPPTLYRNGMPVIKKTISNANNIKGVNQDAVIVAAYNAPASIKEVADFVCDGVNDEVELQLAVDRCQSLLRGGKVLLSSGIFYVDDFPKTEENTDGNKIAIKINNNNSPINIIGDINPYSFNDSNKNGIKGTMIMVSSTCYEGLNSNTIYKIIGADFISRIAGNSQIDFRISNLRIQIPWNLKKIVGIDCRSFNRTVIDTVYISAVLNGYNGWNYSYGGNTRYPDIPVEGSIGVRMMGGSNSDSKNTYRNVCAQGFYEGFAVGSEDVLMEHCYSYWCVYPYTFGNYQWEGGFCQPIVMISCAQYKCTNLPLFVDNGFVAGNSHYTGNQEVVMIAYHGEHTLDGSDAPGGVIGVAAKETTNKMFRGYIDYGIRTSGSGEWKMQSDPTFLFWQHGYGEGFITRNNAHLPAYSSSDRNSKMKGNYLEKVFDLTLGKEVICTDTQNQTWVDCNGNVV